MRVGNLFRSVFGHVCAVELFCDVTVYVRPEYSRSISRTANGAARDTRVGGERENSLGKHIELERTRLFVADS